MKKSKLLKTGSEKKALVLCLRNTPFKKGGLLKNYRLIFNSKQNPKKLILRYNVSQEYLL
ncbi:hypothetical protein BGL57_03145 [Helicobacter pylori]|nr:hypothetical protein BGL57_03145 [Helicobacter pylori]